MDTEAVAANVARLVEARNRAARLFGVMTDTQMALREAELAYNVAMCETRAIEANLAKLAGINTHGIARKLTLQHARYTKSDCRV